MNKTYEPKTFEDKIYADWMEKKYFHSEPDKNKKSFTVVIPPPNITGQLHMGHALNDTLQDCVIRYKRMKGFETLWLPGTDHASIATEVKIVAEMKSEGITKEQIGREGFLQRAYKWKDKYGGRIIEQLQKLGCSCDWDRLAFTMDEKCSKAVKEVFVKLYDKGLIYRGDRIINWCPCCKTAISDAEVDYEQSKSHLWHIRYDVEGEDAFITVATTRPETMLGDTAVAVNPDDERYKKFIGKHLRLPLTKRLIPIIADSYVEKEFGTGAVKITPAHDPNDFEVGLRHNLPVIRVMDDSAVMNELAGEFAGLPRFEARKKIVEKLKEENRLIKTENHDNNVGHCYRCRDIVEPLVSKQWFVKMEPLAKPAVKVVKDKKVNFVPKRFEKTYLHWMENIKDWCISRQLWWGHRIPAYYCNCGKVTVSKDEISVCPECGGKVTQDEAVLDTWFSSALWPFSTLGYPEMTEDLKYYYPTDVLITAYDIIFFWVARMIFSGLEHMGEIPFKDVLIHGIVRDEKGKKMSKSLGNGIDPMEIIESYGADTLRFSLVNGISAGGDIKYSKDKLEGYRNFMNKIWNASRFVLMNCEKTQTKPIGKVKLQLKDQWILTELNKTITEVTKYMDKYEVGLASAKLYDFIWSDFCDWYIELSKPDLNSDKASDTVSVLLHVLTAILKLAHPVIPFITQEIYCNLPGKAKENIMVSAYPVADKKLNFKAEAAAMKEVFDIIKAVRNARQEMNVSQNIKTALYLKPADNCTKLIEENLGYIEKLASGSSAELTQNSFDNALSIVTKIAEIYIPMGDLVDAEKERSRLTKELDDIDSEIKRAEGKLNNSGFVSKAPQSLISAEKDKIEKYHTLKKKVLESLSKLK